jgi:hypothetical protein
MSQASEGPTSQMFQNIPSFKRSQNQNITSLKMSQAAMENIIYFINKDGTFCDIGMRKN